MPIVTEDSQPKRRRAPWLVLVFALVALVPMGVLVWGLFRPVEGTLGAHGFWIGAHSHAGKFRPGLHSLADGWYVSYPLPRPFGGYFVSYTQLHRASN